jgi:YfiR/HmsC-like
VEKVNRTVLCSNSGHNSVFLLSLLSLFLVSSFFNPSSLFAQGPHPTEPQVKAAYLYNFGKFVRWESDPSANTNEREICVFGKDPFGPVLDSTVAGESIDGKKITVRRPANIQDAAQCNILFISSSEEGRIDQILAAARRSGTLTVSDIPHFAEHGGIIEFVMQQDKIRFEVNRRAAEQSHLALSSELLKVAIKVIDKATSQGQP